MGKFKLVYVDGKDWHVAKIGSDNTLEKSTYSSKTEQTAARCNTYSCDGGCTFEHTRLVGGRGGENPIQAWWGSTGPKNAPVREWEDVANTKPWKREDDTFFTSLDNVMSVSDFNAALSRLIEGDPMLVHGAMNDSILVTARPTSISREGLDADTDDSSSYKDAEDESMQDSVTNSRHGVNQSSQPPPKSKMYRSSDACAWFRSHKQMEAVAKSQDDGGLEKKPPILDPDILRKNNEKALYHDPNMNGTTKMRQLEWHERLHKLYEQGDLKQCVLSYFLLCTAKWRSIMLAWMGSKLAGRLS